ncbi:MAG: Trm112 family protein [Proteobacteria bacterium]|nr:Trm112 family protein [Pseudomonadota bacterium]
MNEETGTVDPKLLEMLVCPLTKGPLSYDAGAQELISKQAALAYPIRDGIPIMLIDEARPLDDAAAGKSTGEPPPASNEPDTP